MVSVRFGRFFYSFVLAALAVSVGLLPGCGGGGGGPQVTPTTNPTAPPLAAGRIAWTSDRDGTFHLYVMNGDGTGQVRLTRNSGVERSPSWSKDGTRLVFSYSPDGTLANSDIYSVKSDATGLTRLTNNSVEDNSPVLSPDSQSIVWSQATGSSSTAVFIANSDGSEARQLSESGEYARTPVFDSQNRVVHSSKFVTGANFRTKYQIVRLERDGSGRTVLASTTSNLYSPSVSPDGQTLLYGDDSGGDFEIYSTPTTSFAPKRFPASTPGDSDARWTPDGRIVFSSIRDGNSEIYSANTDGTSLLRLTSNSTTDRLPAVLTPSTK